MSDHDHARTAVLGRIRAALGADPPAPVVVPRDYDHEPFSGGGDVALFAETVAEYRAQVTRIDAAAIGATVASLVPTGAGLSSPPTCRPRGSNVLTPSPTIQHTRCRSHNWRPQRRSSPAARWASR